MKNHSGFELFRKKELLRQFWRCGALFVLTIISLSAVEYSIAIERNSEGRIYFKLDESQVAATGLPRADWTDQLLPQRDNYIDPITIKSLNLPSKAHTDPLFKNIFFADASQVSDLDGLLRNISDSEGVLWAENPPVRYTDGLGGKLHDGIDAPPSDPFYSLQWSLDKIHAPAAWDISHGDRAVVIAVVDAGTDIGHGDLIQQLWVNEMESNGETGVDDDNNGYIDDINGWDFYDDDPDPRPGARDNHGTHVAGIACAGTDNRFGIAGVGYDCRIMAIRAGAGRGITHGFEGLLYAAVNGADVVNLSWGGDDISQLERVVVQYATAQGCLIVAAAGNLNEHPSAFDHYPAAYDEVLAVASTDDHDLRSDFSNSGVWVDVSAPGSRIYSLFPNQSYGIEDGTSMASPIVAGAAGLVKSLHPDWTPERLKKQIEISSDPIDDFNGTYAGKIGSGRINLYRMLADQKSAVIINSVSIIEPDGDGINDPGDRLQISFILRNPLSQVARFSIRMASFSPLLFIEDMSTDNLTLAPGETISTATTPLRARISANAADNLVIKCNLHIEAEDGEVSRIPFTIGVRTSYQTIRNEKIAITVADMGSIGYNDYTTGTGYGEGFRYPVDGLSALFHGSLMVGASGNRVSDNAYGNDNQNSYDFYPLFPGVGVDSLDGKLELETHFSDDSADTILGLDIWQTTIVDLNVADNNYAVLSYALTLQHGFPPLDSVYVCLYLDWDINHSNDNLLHWQSESGLGWMSPVTIHNTVENRSIFGVGVMGRDADFYCGVNRGDVNHSWTDADKSNIFRSGFSRTSGDSPDDWGQLIGVGPLSLAESETLCVAFAMLGGESLAMLSEGLQAARDRHGVGLTSGKPHQPEFFGISSVYPNPFNAQTTVLCRLASGSEYQWSLTDLLGRQSMGANGIAAHTGLMPVFLNAAGLPAGYYHFNLHSSGQSYSSPLILLR